MFSEDDGSINDVIIMRRVRDFIAQEVSTSILIREFNGNFVY